MKKPINYIFVKIRNDQEEMKMAKKESNLASVLSFEKKLVLSDGYMYGTTWEKRNETARPISLIEKSAYIQYFSSLARMFLLIIRAV
mgnify:CR=1 FL=1